MSEKLIDVKGVAKRSKFAVGTVQNLMMESDFPPPRQYTRFGRKLYAIEDVDFYFKTRKSRKRRKR